MFFNATICHKNAYALHTCMQFFHLKVLSAGFQRTKAKRYTDAGVLLPEGMELRCVS